MTQLLTMLNGVSDLEQRMALPRRNEAAEASYTVQSKTLRGVAMSGAGKSLQENISLTVTNDRIDVPVKDADAFLSDYNFEDLPAILGTKVLKIDKKTLEKIVKEVKATAELTFRVRHEGA